MWTWRIAAHTMLDDAGNPRFDGYSGAGHTLEEGRNNPAMVGAIARGPIPPGIYLIGPPHDSPHTGPYTLNLDPTTTTNTLGRSAFRIHGNNAANDASHGCVILPPNARRAIWESGDHVLRVTL